ncbi:NADH:flavin oxidoreductase/NADH oxidase [Salinarchaeum sp. Harcht-Bsk1]|uniref:oxidoreductase n=1 Tax=Salinarchaeum sp. Harcht-Bsk1 TaxID=1333523 RepID=UPI0003424837|nr:NADH:flavin oxidoreductase/NADH oxidase [Salinarchaeum sp. Harcht-Bsk1]AGN00618.1 NADH:flavin oxidoreductase/NADH oxidase [Salinarchaeum sp. Harcht-Bsk1]
MPTLRDPVELGGLELSNRLYRAPVLECAGTNEDTAERLVAELEPAAAAGAGLVFQGATIVRSEGGCAAPGMTRFADDSFVTGLAPVPDAVHDHGGRIFCQLAHGGLRSMEVWHAEYRSEHPDLTQAAAAVLPWQFRLLDRIGVLDFSPEVLTTAEVEALAADFGRAAARAVDAGYDGIHLAGANMGILQQFLSPFYNRRSDRFADGVRLLEAIHDEIRERAGEDVPIVTKVPSERPAPRIVHRHLTDDDAVAICERLAAIGFDGLVPVRTSVTWDMSIVRGKYPERSWNDEQFQAGYDAAFGSRLQKRLVQALNWLQARRFGSEPGWNADLARRVRERVDVPVLLEGGLREREQIDALLGDACDLAGMARPFYAEPELPARLLSDPDAVAVCEDCNNCTVPQVTGASGICRTPSVLERRGELEREGAYDRSTADEVE